MRLLVFGARPKSLGAEIAKSWLGDFESSVKTAGIAGEDYPANPLSDTSLHAVLEDWRPDRVVVTIGMNEPRDSYDTFEEWMMEHLEVNCAFPMKILAAWMDIGPPRDAHFVAISSNSAVIPRSNSMAYCSSKAALSMALRCGARDLAKAEVPMRVYGYEPGLIRGTPMTEATLEAYEGPPTRMLGLPQGLPVGRLATLITSHLQFGGPELNGVLMRIDAGEV